MNTSLFLLRTAALLPVRLFSRISPFALIRDSRIDKRSAVSRFCRIYSCEIGKYTYIGPGTTITHTKIGSFCSIAKGCLINPGKHPIEMVSTSPVFYTKKNILKKCFYELDFNEHGEVFIGNDVWIGAHAIIKEDVSIGNGAIVGAGAVVTNDVPPYAIVGGVPAKIIKMRFTENEISSLEKIKWWEFSEKQLLEFAPNMNSPEFFLKHFFEPDTLKD